MNIDPLFVVVAIACLTVLGILIMGISTMGKTGVENGKRSNKFMRWRIYAQFFAIILIFIFVYFRRGG